MPLDADVRPSNQRSPVFKTLGVVLALLFFCLFMALGIWQVQRLFWKLDLIARIDARVHATAVPAPAKSDWSNITAANDEYRPVTLSGQYLNESEVLVKALTERGSGYWVMTPMKSADGTVTFINRGFVPDNKRDVATRKDGEISEPTEVTGLLRMPEPNGFFLRPNDPAKDLWNSRDVAAFAHMRNLGAVAPYFIDADATPNSGGMPVGGLTVVSFRNSHLTYAITWFILAAMIAGASFYVWRHEKRSE